MRDRDHLLAISSRSVLSEFLTTTLIMRGYAAVHANLVQNLGAQISEGGFTVLLKIAERDSEMAALLGARSDIPSGLLRKFLAMVAEKSKSAFLRAASPPDQGNCGEGGAEDGRHLEQRLFIRRKGDC